MSHSISDAASLNAAPGMGGLGDELFGPIGSLTPPPDTTAAKTDALFNAVLERDPLGLCTPLDSAEIPSRINAQPERAYSSVNSLVPAQSAAQISRPAIKSGRSFRWVRDPLGILPPFLERTEPPSRINVKPERTHSSVNSSIPAARPPASSFPARLPQSAAPTESLAASTPQWILSSPVHQIPAPILATVVPKDNLTLAAEEALQSETKSIKARTQVIKKYRAQKIDINPDELTQRMHSLREEFRELPEPSVDQWQRALRGLLQINNARAVEARFAIQEGVYISEMSLLNASRWFQTTATPTAQINFLKKPSSRKRKLPQTGTPDFLRPSPHFEASLLPGSSDFHPVFSSSSAPISHPPESHPSSAPAWTFLSSPIHQTPAPIPAAPAPKDTLTLAAEEALQSETKGKRAQTEIIDKWAARGTSIDRKKLSERMSFLQKEHAKLPGPSAQQLQEALQLFRTIDNARAVTARFAIHQQVYIPESTLIEEAYRSGLPMASPAARTNAPKPPSRKRKLPQTEIPDLGPSPHFEEPPLPELFSCSPFPSSSPAPKPVSQETAGLKRATKEQLQQATQEAIRTGNIGRVCRRYKTALKICIPESTLRDRVNSSKFKGLSKPSKELRNQAKQDALTLGVQKTRKKFAETYGVKISKKTLDNFRSKQRAIQKQQQEPNNL